MMNVITKFDKLKPFLKSGLDMKSNRINIFVVDNPLFENKRNVSLTSYKTSGKLQPSNQQNGEKNSLQTSFAQSGKYDRPNSKFHCNLLI